MQAGCRQGGRGYKQRPPPHGGSVLRLPPALCQPPLACPLPGFGPSTVTVSLHWKSPSFGGGGGGIAPHDRPSHTSAEVWGFYLTPPSQGVGVLPAPPPQARSWGAAGWGCNRMGVQTLPPCPSAPCDPPWLLRYGCAVMTHGFCSRPSDCAKPAAPRPRPRHGTAHQALAGWGGPRPQHPLHVLQRPPGTRLGMGTERNPPNEKP